MDRSEIRAHVQRTLTFDTNNCHFAASNLNAHLLRPVPSIKFLQLVSNLFVVLMVFGWSKQKC
jgi:hypothetical protein